MQLMKDKNNTLNLKATWVGYEDKKKHAPRKWLNESLFQA